MRFHLRGAALLPCVPGLALTLSCGAGAGLHASNGAKMGEALAFAAVAAAAQVAQSAAEQHARSSAPITHASYGSGSGGVSVTQDCDNQGQYGCVTVTPSSSGSDAPPPDADLSDEDLRDYVLGYVNGVRKLNAVAPIVREGAIDAFAQAGSDELSTDHKQNQHMTEHARELHGASAELQGSPDGARPGSRQDRIAEILLAWMAEGKGGMHHDTLLRGDWTRLGVGLATREGRLYFTADFAGP